MTKRFYRAIYRYSFLIDIDECLNASACPLNTICKNLPGNFSCECKPGFQVKKGEQHFGCEGVVFFVDIDECESSGACISKNTVCISSPESYDCICKDGYYLAAPVRLEHHNPMYNTCYAKGLPCTIRFI
ncbi:hypothetical protein NPIL_76031 [Nephila pilipes]|uniref:EGF-like domain-containing protein n=1 Tax=Nephila pilipes TaxID=299642 RepID=A0A8X6MKS9_NEPPI|nr:hypothetical protein NPIL_76031 [Nephila pilipes]